MAKPQHPIERVGRFFPIFIIILIIIISVVYLQSLKVMNDTSGKESFDTTSQDVGSEIQKGADDLFENLGFTVTSLLEKEQEEIESEPLPDAQEIVLDVPQERFEKKKNLDRAIEFFRPDGFINSDSFRLVDLVGKKIVLLEFCTFSSMNCIRGYPFMEGLYEKYRDLGLEVVTIHTPEFEFEKKPGFVMQMTGELDIKYSVVLDNEYRTWRAYKNKYWPTRYLIDVDGFIVETYKGEGHYSAIESKVKEVLEERANISGEDVLLPKDLLRVYTPNFDSVKTPTIYLGAMKNRGDFGNDEGYMTNLPVIYKVPDAQIPNVVYVEGEWFNNDDYMELVSDTGRVVVEYTAKDVNMVASGGNSLKVFIDGNNATELFVNREGIYDVISDKVYGTHQLEIDIENPGFKLYSLSFS